MFHSHSERSAAALFEEGIGAAKRELEPETASALARHALLYEERLGHALVWCSWLACGNDTPLPGRPSQNSVCGVVWKTGDMVYHCRTCGMDPSCAICHDCFVNSNHEGHDYWMFSSGGGCCDCGDIEAWRCAGFCTRHRGQSSDEDGW